MDISVVICTYNRGEHLRRVLADFPRQQNVSNVSFEVVIVDNNSTDNTKQICETYIASHPEIFRYLFEERQGKTFALNTGIRESQGKIVAFTDDDVLIDNNWLSSIKKATEIFPDCKAFGGRVIPVWPDIIPRWIVREGDFKNIGGVIVEHDYGDIYKDYPQDIMWPPIGANMFFMREIIEKYGGFNENLNKGVKKIPMLEDTELCNRLLKNNEKMIYIPDSVVIHPVYQERLTKNYFRKHAFKTGRAQYFVQHIKYNIQNNRRVILNVPMYLARNVANMLIKYFVAICKSNQQMIFYFEKMIIYLVGTVYECFLQRNNEQT